jgi:hypothetical protein
MPLVEGEDRVAEEVYRWMRGLRVRLEESSIVYRWLGEWVK